MLPLESFNRDRSRRDGRVDRCGPCRNASVKTWRHRTGRTQRAVDSRVGENGHFRCSKCREYKAPGSFRWTPSAERYHAYCRPCQAAGNREWRRANSPRYEASKALRRGHRDVIREFGTLTAWREWCREDARAMFWDHYYAGRLGQIRARSDQEAA